MVKRIGEILVEMGLITPDQLRAALRTQLARGGHLGTCLIEMNCLDEERLGRVLAEIYQVKYVHTARFSNIPQPVIDSVPRQVVERRRVIPIFVEGGDLHVAMINPKDLHAIDELTFATGMDIRPWISPEVRIALAMEHYYDITISPRFIRLNLGKQKHLPDPLAGSTITDTVPTIPLAVHTAASPSLHAPQGSTAAATVFSSASPTVALPVVEEDDAEWELIGQALIEQIPRLNPGAGRQPRESSVNEAGLLREFEQVSDALCNASNSSTIAQAGLECAARGLSRCILFVVRRLQAHIWDWRGFGLDPSIVRRIRFPVDACGIFELLAGSELYRGPIPLEPSMVQFYRELDLAVPTEALVVPIYFQERLAAILYGDGGDLGRIVGETDIYHRLAQRMGIALTLLALKRKLRRA